MPYIIHNIFNQWGRKDRGKDFENRIEFLDRHKKPFSWENEELDNEKFFSILDSDDKVIYLDVPAEIPGVVLESDFKDDEPAIIKQGPPTFVERAVGAQLNAMLEENTGVQARKLIGVHGEST